MCYMATRTQVGVRELRQNLSVHLARVIRGETLEVTDRGLPVAVLAPLAQGATVLDRLRLAGRLIPHTKDLLALERPKQPVSRRGTRALQQQRRERL